MLCSFLDIHLSEIVMTPSKRGNVTCISIAKVRKELIDESQVAHKAGGQHKGLVVKKQASGIVSSFDVLYVCSVLL